MYFENLFFPPLINGVMMCLSDPCSPPVCTGHLGHGRMTEEDEADRGPGDQSRRQSDGKGTLAENAS